MVFKKLLNTILITLIATSITVRKANSDGCYVTMQSKENIWAALEVCHIQQMKLPTPSELESWENRLNGTEYFDRERLFVWSSIFKETFSQWKTMDGSNYKENLISESTRIHGQDCAVLRTKDSFIDEDYFTTDLTGYLCSREESDMRHGLLVYGDTVVFEEHHGPWFSAYKKCSDKGGTLAAPPYASVENEWVRNISEYADQHNLHGHYAIGLRRAAWFSVGMGRGYSDIVDDLKWGPGQPAVDGDCVKYGPKHLISTAYCHDKEWFLCLDTKKQTLYMNNSTPHPSNKERSGHKGATIIVPHSLMVINEATLTVTCLLFLAITGIICCLCCDACLNKKERRKERDRSYKQDKRRERRHITAEYTQDENEMELTTGLVSMDMLEDLEEI